MSSYYRLRKVLLCAVLELGVLMGAPMRPEEIKDLMPAVHRTVVEDDTDDSAASLDQES